MNRIGCLLLFFPCYAQSYCFDDAGQRYNVDSKLLQSIAMVESALNSRAYNENKNKEGQVISRDYGLMQINSTHFDRLSKFNIDSTNIYEPCLNVMLGAWILSENFSSHGYNWNSVGAYNAGFKKSNHAARQRYISKVKAALAQLE